WWGSRPPPDPQPTVADLIARGLLTDWQSAGLIDLISRGLSAFVVSEASGAGKSSLLAALIAEAPASGDHVYLRGNYETFDFLADDPVKKPVLLVNEISPHLPAYLWGRPVTTLFAAMQRGYQALGTAHAGSAAAFLHLLTSSPLRVPMPMAAQPMLVVVLGPRRRERPGDSALLEVSGIRPGRDSATALLETIFSKDGSPRFDADAARRLMLAAGLPADRLWTGLEADH
ncbi:MAG: hypothetical protein AB7G88_15825, partial [Thermomicrobiales bacterium]